MGTYKHPRPNALEAQLRTEGPRVWDGVKRKCFSTCCPARATGLSSPPHRWPEKRFPRLELSLQSRWLETQSFFISPQNVDPKEARRLGEALHPQRGRETRGPGWFKRLWEAAVSICPGEPEFFSSIFFFFLFFSLSPPLCHSLPSPNAALSSLLRN